MGPYLDLSAEKEGWFEAPVSQFFLLRKAICLTEILPKPPFSRELDLWIFIGTGFCLEVGSVQAIWSS